VTTVSVELVDLAGRSVGRAEKDLAHLPPGQLHRATSVFLLDSDEALILQRRAAAKYHSGGLWSNTVCGHPLPGEEPTIAACRRLMDELGLVFAPQDLVPSGVVTYSVRDPVSSLVEREYNHLFVGRASGRLNINDEEVAETRSLPLTDLPAFRSNHDFSAWFDTLLEAAMQDLIELARAGPTSRG
jgi:isopentenyl-diphosphate Delta-isomerase